MAIKKKPVKLGKPKQKKTSALSSMKGLRPADPTPRPKPKPKPRPYGCCAIKRLGG